MNQEREQPPPTLEEQEAFLTGRAMRSVELYGARDPNALMWKALLESIRKLRAGAPA